MILILHFIPINLIPRESSLDVLSKTVSLESFTFTDVQSEVNIVFVSFVFVFPLAGISSTYMNPVQRINLKNRTRLQMCNQK